LMKRISYSPSSSSRRGSTMPTKCSSKGSINFRNITIKTSNNITLQLTHSSGEVKTAIKLCRSMNCQRVSLAQVSSWATTRSSTMWVKMRNSLLKSTKRAPNNCRHTKLASTWVFYRAR
jgi:hypothetical protein